MATMNPWIVINQGLSFCLLMLKTIYWDWDPNRSCEMRKDSTPGAREISPIPLFQMTILTSSRLTMPGASRVAPARIASLFGWLTGSSYHTIHLRHHGRDIVVIAIQCSYLEVLVVVRCV